MVCGLFDLNMVDNEDETASSFVSPSSSVASGNSESAPTSSSAVCMELWHACAGPLISLPKKGSAVVYLPQGHVEHLPEHPAIVYDLPPHVFCRVVDVKLHADAANDEVYAQVSLIPDQQQIDQKWRENIIETGAEDEDAEGARISMTPHMFCKTLTASDTSTHGGFSVPRRAAEDCFPPLDYKQQRPSQELVAKDLHGIEWKFRHIYRGQPRRHLLTTGWSAFVNKKKLVSGDAVLFLRGGDGELRLGIRRAAQVKSDANILPPNSSQQVNASNIAAIVNAISMCSTFSVCYNPRARSSKIIVPYHKFSKSLAHSLSSGTRFKIRLETEDSSERSGLIVGVSDMDPVRWPGSKWKCLLVRWDDMEVNCLNRVSPWEIEPSGSLSGPNSFVLPSTKRSRLGFPAPNPDFLLPKDGNEVSDFGEPLRFQKVLQGQEVSQICAPYLSVQTPSHHHPSEIRHFPGLVYSGARENFLEGTALGESSQFRKVLQGQETWSILPYGRGPEFNNRFQVNNSGNAINGARLPTRENSWSVLNHIYARPPPLTSVNQKKPDSLGLSQRIPLPSQQLLGDNQKFVSTCKKSFRLFGFPLTEEKVATNNGDSPTASSYESNLLPCNEDQMYQPPLITKVMVGSWLK